VSALGLIVVGVVVVIGDFRGREHLGRWVLCDVRVKEYPPKCKEAKLQDLLATSSMAIGSYPGSNAALVVSELVYVLPPPHTHTHKHTHSPPPLVTVSVGARHAPLEGEEGVT
jgi:hypothetical protein